ncbi:hypothetical protein OIU78_011166 [Salix suchowensis]|nr:hypothetical protein OIU78_011166 [Salix suchowensis]
MVILGRRWRRSGQQLEQGFDKAKSAGQKAKAGAQWVTKGSRSSTRIGVQNKLQSSEDGIVKVVKNLDGDRMVFKIACHFSWT